MTPSWFETVSTSLRSGEPVALSTVVALDPGEAESSDELPPLGAKLVVRGTDTSGSLGSAELDRVVARDTSALLDAGTSATRHYGPRGEAGLSAVTVFVEAFSPPRHMIIFGAVDFTAALVRVAKVLGYRVTVCDARPVFATEARFPDADEVVVDWPHRYLAKVGDELVGRDAVCVLTHDHKFDVPALVAALGTSVGYIGAMGSRHTHAGRLDRLRAEGVTEEALRRVMAPVGLDIGARTPEETAVAICAEIIATGSKVAVRSLRDGAGPIHPEA